MKNTKDRFPLDPKVNWWRLPEEVAVLAKKVNDIEVGGGVTGSPQDLQDVTDEGESTTNNIQFLDNAKILFDNGSRLQKGTTNSQTGGNGGVAQVCSIDYELKWEAGRQYVMQQDGFTIREVRHNFTLTPGVNDDSTRGFVPDSRWILDNGDTYVCTDNTAENAIWVLIFTAQNPGLFAQTALGTLITNTTVETSLIGTGVGSLTVPANAFQVGDSFTAKMCGYLSCANNETIHIRVKSDGITIADAGIFQMKIATNKYFELTLDFTITKIGAAGVAELFTNGQYSYNHNAAGELSGNNFALVSNTVFDTTVVNALSITAEWGLANTANKIQSQNCVLTKVY
jgi:hypothetical protein